MNAWCAFVAGWMFGAAVFADGVRLPTWARWLSVTIGILDLWVGSL